MKSKDFIPPDGELEEKKKFLQSPIEDRVKAFMKAGSVGPLNILDYTFKVPIIVPRGCLLYTSPSPRDLSTSRMPSSA